MVVEWENILYTAFQNQAGNRIKKENNYPS